MSQLTAPIQQAEDYRLDKHVWLMRIAFAGRMLESRHPRVPADTQEPKLLLYRALHILIHIVRNQIEPEITFSDAPPTSTITWYDQRFDHEEYRCDFNSEDRHPEMFERHLKGVLCDGFHRGMLVDKAWGSLWLAFMKQMAENKYHHERYKGKAVAQQWEALSLDGQVKFIKTIFALGFDAMKRSLDRIMMSFVEDPAVRGSEEHAADLNKQQKAYTFPLAYCGSLGEEVEAFNRYLWRLAGTFLDFVIEKGHEQECTDINQWYEYVKDPAELQDKECPICYAQYIVAPTGASTNASVPVKFSCHHIVCLTCLKQWADSEADNHDKCPTCRGVLHPPNPHEQYNEDFWATVRSLNEIEEDSTPQAYAEKAVAMLDVYVSKLPVSITDVDTRKNSNACANTIEDIKSWLTNMSVPPNPEDGYLARLCFSQTPEQPADLYDVQGNAALHCLHWTRERLRAYLVGDQALYRKSCEYQLYSYAHSENVSYSFMLYDWQAEFEDRLEEEEEEEEHMSVSDPDDYM